MNRKAWCIVGIVGLAICLATSGGQSEEVAAPAEAEKQKVREARFKAMLEDVVFKGTWQMTNERGLKGKAPMTPPREDRYSIKRVSKGVGNNWVILARVEFADKDVTLPFNVKVLWAGDTPVITLDKLKMPGLGTYSARVVIREGFYGGTWRGATYGGVLSGQIIKAADEKMVDAQAAQGFKMNMPTQPEQEKADK